MIRRLLASSFLWIVLSGSILRGQSAPAPTVHPSLIVVVGAPGETEYGDAFARWGTNWQKAGATAGIVTRIIGNNATGGEEDLSLLRAALKEEPIIGPEPMWLVLLGHGSYAAGEAKFNLRGADVSAKELAEMLAPFSQRPVVVVAAFSAGGAFLPVLSKSNRMIVAATRNGSENNYSRLGQYLSETIIDPSADLDHDGQTSLLEAWLSAAGRVAAFYKSEGRLATEHSLLDDNGDGRGTPADFFSGLRLIKKPAGNAAADGLRAHQLCFAPSAIEKTLAPAARAQRDALELELAQLRNTKANLPEAEYYQRLEAVLSRLARVYEGSKEAAPKP